MLKRFNSILGNNALLLRNFASLSALQISNYVIPFITFPYLTRVLGPEKFGLINFAVALTAYFGVIADYGFNLSASRDVSVNRDNPEAIADIIKSVYAIKAMFVISGFILLLILIYSIPLFRQNYLFFLCSYGIILGDALFPFWYFQGVEKMKFIAILNIGVKSLSAIMIFIFVTNQADALHLVIINSSASILTGIAGAVLVFSLAKINFKPPKIKTIWLQLKGGLPVFLSTFSISFYTVSNSFVLGILTGNRQVGLFTGADKIRNAAQGVLQPLLQASYPKTSFLLNRRKAEGERFAKRLLYINGAISFVISLSIFIFAELIVRIILGGAFSDAVSVLRTLAFLPFLITLSNVGGIQIMLGLGKNKQFAYIIASAGILNVILLFLLIPELQSVGAALSVLITETFVTAAIFLYLKKKKILFN